MKIYLSGFGKGDGSISDNDFHFTFQKLGVSRFSSFYEYKNRMKVYFAGGEERQRVFDDTKVERALFSFL